ncbi:MAG: FtsX-like permease family protein [Kineosporiaceae bacterium]
MGNGGVANSHRGLGTARDCARVSPRVEEDALSGWGLRAVVRRGRSQWGLLTVVAAVSLLACTLMSVLALTYQVTRDVGLPRTLQRLDPATTTVLASIEQGSGQEYGPAQQAVDAAVDAVLALPVRSRTEVIRSEWANPDGLGTSTWLYFAHLDGIDEHLRVTAGHLPTAADRVGTGEVAVAVPASFATRARIAVGARVRTSETSTTSTAVAVVVGVYDVPAASRKAWGTDPLSGTTHDPQFAPPGSGGMFTVDAYGPLLTSREGFTAGPLHPLHADITAVPDLSGVTPATLPRVQARVDSLAREVPRRVGNDAVQQVGVSSRLGAALDRANRSLVVTTAGLVITGSLVLVLAVAALLLATRLLAERRSTEQTLMRARGASGGQLARLAAIEAGALALITAVLAPPAARALYGVVARRGRFAAAGLSGDPGLPPLVWGVAAATAAALVAVLLTPLLRRAGTFVEQEQAAARQDRRSLIQRTGVDLGLVALAAVGYWQLVRYSSPTSGSGREARVDPVLVAGPGLVLLAGGMLSVRAIPMLARRLEPAAARGPAVVWPLASWEVGRRVRRSVGAVLLLSLAIASGTFSLAYLETWRTAQVDQADARVGADAVADLSQLDPLAQPDAIGSALHAAAPSGATATMPVLSRDAGFSAASDGTDYGRRTSLGYGVPVQLLAVGSADAAGMFRGRTGKVGGPADDLLDELPGLAPAAARGLALPASTRQLSLRARLTGETTSGPVTARLSAVLTDSSGARSSVDLGSLTSDGAPHRLGARLPAVSSGPPGAVAAGRLSLVALVVAWSYDISPETFVDGLPQARLTLGGLAAGPDGNAPVDLRAWQGAEATGQGLAETSVTVLEDAGASLGAGRVPGLQVSATLVPGDDSRFASMTTSVVGWATQPAVRGVVTPAALRRLGLQVGAEAALVIEDVAVPVEIVGTSDVVPGTDGLRDAVVVDLDALSRRFVEYGAPPPAANRWWVRVPDADAPRPRDAVAARGGRSPRPTSPPARPPASRSSWACAAPSGSWCSRRACWPASASRSTPPWRSACGGSSSRSCSRSGCAGASSSG